jgi:hypothetical protein
VTYDPNGWQRRPASLEKLYGSTYGKLRRLDDAAMPTPTWPGILSGWFTAASGGTGSPTPYVSITGNTTLYLNGRRRLHRDLRPERGQRRPASQITLGSTYGKASDGTRTPRSDPDMGRAYLLRLVHRGQRRDEDHRLDLW